MKQLLYDRQFWAFVLGLMVLVVATFVPGFEINVEEGVGLLVVVMSYILGVAVDPGGGGWRGVLKSRKFWMAAVGFVFIMLRGFDFLIPAELSVEVVTFFMVSLGSLIAGIGLKDMTQRK